LNESLWGHSKSPFVVDTLLFSIPQSAWKVQMKIDALHRRLSKFLLTEAGMD